MKDYSEFSLFDLAGTYDEMNEEDFPQQLIDQELIRGSGFEGGKYRIYKWFQEDHTEKENQRFLASEYGIGGRSTDFGFADHDSKGLRFRKYEIGHHDLKNEKQFNMNWGAVSKRIQTLIAVDRYLSEAELQQYQIMKKSVQILYQPHDETCECDEEIEEEEWKSDF